MRTKPPYFVQNRLLQGMICWLILVWIVAAIKPFDRSDWLLENILVFVYGLLLIISYPRFRFSNLSYGLFTLFLTLHLIGAHYTYAEVPFGFWLQESLQLERNHFDRIVHFSYGLLIAYPFREILLRRARVAASWSYFLAVNLVLAFSGFYEVMEFWVAIVVSPELGMAYLGTQGDIWDAHHDMFLAMLGAVIAMLVTYALRRKPILQDDASVVDKGLYP